jgi:methylglutaconyl-CoA hydratase
MARSARLPAIHAMSYRFLQIQRDGPVDHLILNRPEVRNAFNDEMIHELAAWAEGARADSSLRAVVLSGAGATFCAGADLTWMSSMVRYSLEDNVRDAMAASAMFDAFNTLPVPVIGRVHGAALGGGCGLVAICDIVVAEDSALFGFTETKLGILPAIIAPFALAKIGVSAARELFLTGMRFSAARAREIGLVHAVTDPTALDERVQQYVRELLTASPTAIARAKGLLQQIAGRPPADVRELTCRTIADQRVSPEGQDGMRAFLEKRKAGWIRE